MGDHSSAQLPPPKYWQDFERCCRVLFECILKDPQTQLNGRGGQPQHGVDVYGKRGGISGQWVGIQCKGKEITTYGNNVSEEELRAEVKKAFNFTPQLSEFILATTAPNDAEIQRVARLITEENKKAGKLMTVDVFGWGELQSRISQHPEAIRAFHPDLTPFSDEFLTSQAKIDTKLDKGLATISNLEKMVTALYTATGNTSGSTSQEQSNLEAQWHREIDSYRDLILNGKSKTGMELLERLKGEIWAKASDRIKFRITTNIGAALLRLGEEKNAADNFLSAIAYDPYDKIGMANVSLAHILLGDIGKAIESAQIALRQYPENEDAAGYLIQAHYNDQNITDPFSLVPDNLCKKRAVVIGAIFFWRKRDMPNWHKIAHEAAKLFPEANELKRASAEAYLDALSESKWILLGHSISAKQNLKNLSDAATVLQSLWDAIKTGENKIDISLPNNLALAYRILGKYEDGAKVIDEALSIAPYDIALIKLRAIFYISLHQEEDALKLLLKKRGTDPEAAILTAELLVKQDPKQTRDILSEIDKAGITDELRVPASLIRIDSYLQEGNHDIALEHTKSLVTNYPQRIDVIIASSNIQRERGDVDAEKTLLQAKHIINENSSFVDRFLVAKELHYSDYNDDAVEILDGHIDFQRDTPALKLFLSSLKGSNRRRQAYECITSLPSEIAEKPWYLKIQAGVHIDRGDYPSAEKALDKYLQLCPDDLSMRHIWVGICIRRLEGSAKIRAFLEGNVESLQGNVIDRMQLTILLARFGFEERALQLGYRIFLENPDNPEIHFKYMALLLQPNKPSEIDLDVKVIGPDVVFVIENNRGEKDDYLIENDKQLSIDRHTITTDHTLAKKVIGLKVGDTFTIDNAIGPPENWRIKSIKHKYLDALHKCMDRFNRQFPSFQGFQRVVFDPKSPDIILAPIKARHDALQSSFDQFDQAPVPILIFAEILGTDVIKALQSIIHVGKKFRVCIGTVEERDIASKAIACNSKNGCVTDALTFYIIRRLGLEDTIVEICGRIGITESSVDVFRQRREEIELHGGKPFLVMSFQNGQYFREEITAEKLQTALDETQNDLIWIEKNCDILPAESDLGLLPEFSNISKRVGKNIFNSILAADCSHRILLCEDYPYRLLATQNGKLPAAWLQPVLMTALDKKILSPEKYDEAIYYMLESRFEYITVDARNLSRAANSEKDVEGKRFNRIAEALGGPHADMLSHIKVAASFFNEIWKEYDPSLKRKAQTSKVLECLLNGRREEFSIIARTLNISVKSPERAFRNYLIDWLKGHFYLPFNS
jgi:tetratricopeptide (TPR) repeat protein